MGTKEISKQLRDGNRYPDGPAKLLAQWIVQLCDLSRNQEFLRLEAQAARYIADRALNNGRNTAKQEPTAAIPGADPAVGKHRPPDGYDAERTAIEDHHRVVLDRSEELRHLVDKLRCSGSYHVIVAPAFAGKTAFMVELHRRLRAEDYRTAVFYIVEHYSNRSQNFLEAVIGQLLWVCQSSEKLSVADERPAQFARLWADFAALGTVDRPVVLLIDGLDEQSPVDMISPLLPVHLSGYAHVVVATRGLPDFRDAVPRHHALATSPISVISLVASPHAKVRTDHARRDLEKWLRSADSVRENMATLLLVAGAPLSRHDFADLLDLSVGQVDLYLHDIERCLLPMTIEVGGVGYQWVHAKYSEFVANWVSAKGRVHAIQQVLTWADRYAGNGWPDTTPPFLLHGLHHFLRTHHDIGGPVRLAGLVTNSRRQRLLAEYGHDRAFLDTVAFTRDALHEIDGDSANSLELMFRVELHRMLATAAAAPLPLGLLRLFVLLGQADQAEGVAFCVDERYRARALAEVSEALTEIGDTIRASKIADRAWDFATADDDKYHQFTSIRACARAARKAGTEIFPSVIRVDLIGEDPRLLCEYAGYLVEIGEQCAARAEIDRLIKPGPDYDRLGGWVLAEAAASLSLLGDLDAAARTARRAISRRGVSGEGCGAQIGQVVASLVRASRADDATGIASAIANSRDSLRARVHGALIEALSEAGDYRRAQDILERELELANSVRTSFLWGLDPLLYLRGAQANCGTGDVEVLKELLRCVDREGIRSDDLGGLVKLGEAFLAMDCRQDAARVAQFARELSGPAPLYIDDDSMRQMAVALIKVGDIFAARNVAGNIDDHTLRTEAKRTVEIAEAIAEAAAGEFLPTSEYAKKWSPWDRAQLAVTLAGVEGAARTARELATELILHEDQAHGPGRGDLAASYCALRAIEALRRVSSVEHCETVLARLSSSGRAGALAKLSGICRATDAATADRLFEQAVNLACHLTERNRRVSVLCEMLKVAGSLQESTPGIVQALTIFRQELESEASLELGYSLATSLHDAGLNDLARAFALKVYEICEIEDDLGNGRSYDGLLCSFLVVAGMHDHALHLAEGAGWLTLASLANEYIANGDMRTARRAAELAFKARRGKATKDSDGVAIMILLMLDVGRVDLAKHLFQEDYVGPEGDQLVSALIRGLVVHGREREALSLSCSSSLEPWRGAALVAWSAAPAWPTDMRRRNLQLLHQYTYHGFIPDQPTQQVNGQNQTG
ncbi:hypothetical protein AB0F52_00715 [Amycolatopsis sp. NPDC024027]|uniref:hypothetical protein n=1 Tax=Amycolatopsis sp. NPDC024027 TaxID=3154327 RepID=UPI0033DBFDA6